MVKGEIASLLDRSEAINHTVAVAVLPLVEITHNFPHEILNSKALKSGKNRENLR
jgi:hypothetical protein